MFLKVLMGSFSLHDLLVSWHLLWEVYMRNFRNTRSSRVKEKWKLHFNIIIHSITALAVSPEKSPAEVSAKAQIHVNEWNNHLQSDGVAFVPSLTLLPLSSSSTLPHPSSQSLFVLLNHLCVEETFCLFNKRGANRESSIQCDKRQSNKEIWRKTNRNQLHCLSAMTGYVITITHGGAWRHLQRMKIILWILVTPMKSVTLSQVFISKLQFDLLKMYWWKLLPGFVEQL